MSFLPCLSFKASNRRWPTPVKSVVVAGAYSSATRFAPVFASAALNAATPSWPKALSTPSTAMLTPGAPIATAFEIASCDELRPVRKM
jgi:hypothetical protein